MVDVNLTWNNHIDQLISKLNSACYAIRAVNATLSRKGLRTYFSYVHSIMSYGIILGVNTPNSIKIFRIQKENLRIMNKAKKMDSCRELFKSMKILPLYSQCIFSLLMYFIHSFIYFSFCQSIQGHRQPIGYRTCHTANAI